jgi:fructosamine-3-kinase
MSGATVEEFKMWESLAKKYSISQLEFIIKDCRCAQSAMRGWNPEKENYYSDQRMTYSAELMRRKKKC